MWADGVTDFQTAINFTNARLVEAICALPQQNVPLQIADLGCGLGGSLFYLTDHLQAEFTGVGLTISPMQARLAHQRMANLDVSSNASMPMRNIYFLEGDFFHVPLQSGFDAVYSIEAFCHAPAAQPYLTEVARLLRPGGRWIICDDFLSAPAPSTQLPPPEQQFWLNAYQDGWRVPNIHSVSDIVRMAQAVGLHLVSDTPFSQWLRLRTLPQALAKWLIRLTRALPLRHEIVPSMIGSLALQHCLRLGVIDYRFLVFERHV